MNAVLAMIGELLTSKKGAAAIAAIVLVICQHYGIIVDEEMVLKLLGIIGTYILGQGIADVGKSAAKIANKPPE